LFSRSVTASLTRVKFESVGSAFSMNSDTGWADSFAGFMDYFKSFDPPSEVGWMVIGFSILLGTVISIFPQVHVLISHRSSYGLNSFTIFVTSFGQFILVVNILCLRTSDFIGALQYAPGHWIGRFLTFINATALWFCYLPIVFLNLVFFDRQPRPLRGSDKIQAEAYFNRMMSILTPIVALVIVAVYVIGVVLHGFGSDYVVTMGRFFGTAACFLCIAQYVPQMVTTCKLRDNGSLSIPMLCIQAPGGLVNSLFLWLGQGDDWTTWISILAAAIQQFILLGICFFYKIRKKKEKLAGTEGSVSTPSMTVPLIFDIGAYE
jgi:uncharacterized protein with PQ loop repeat